MFFFSIVEASHMFNLRLPLPFLGSHREAQDLVNQGQAIVNNAQQRLQDNDDLIQQISNDLQSDPQNVRLQQQLRETQEMNAELSEQLTTAESNLSDATAQHQAIMALPDEAVEKAQAIGRWMPTASLAVAIIIMSLITYL